VSGGSDENMDCREVDALAERSLDGEADAVDEDRLLQHGARCPRCLALLQSKRWFKGLIQSRFGATEEGPRAPDALKQRIEWALHSRPKPRGRRWAIYGTLSVLVAAIGFGWRYGSVGTALPSGPVARHTRNLPPEVRADQGPDAVNAFLKRNLSYPVEVPHFAEAKGVRLVGARLDSIDDQDAAYVMYEQRGARISFFAYPRRRDWHAETPQSFERRQVGSKRVLVGRYHGYNVVAWHSDALVFSLVSDLDGQQLVRLANSP
jgi:anti-sigma factor RsiW